MKHINRYIKKIFLVIFLSIVIQVSAAQSPVSNTSWKGIFEIPDPTPMVLQFKMDTLFLNFADNNNNLETMHYKLRNDTLSIFKISGESPCNDVSDVLYKIVIKDDRMYVSSLTDCNERIEAWPAEGLTKMKNGDNNN